MRQMKSFRGFNNKSVRPTRIVRSVYFDSNHNKAVNELAKKLNISVNALMNIAITDLLAKKEDLKTIKKVIKKDNNIAYQNFGEYKRTVVK